MDKTSSQRPLQRISWKEKTAKQGQWFKENADYLIGRSTFPGLNGNNTVNHKQNMQTMYAVYNNQIPLSWFDHLTDPLSAKDPKHKRFPAKVRPTNILRTTIDLLLGEWPRRPFKYRVENIGEDGYNRFLAEKNNVVKQSLSDLFFAVAQEEAMANGASEEELSQMTPDMVPPPADVARKFTVSYKDKLAIKANKWLKRSIIEYSVRQKLLAMFKDYLLAGEAISYKGIHQGEVVYKRLSPLYADYDKSPDTEFIEDGEWFTYVHLMTPSDVVDNFYDELKEEDHKYLENAEYMRSPTVFFDYVNGLNTQEQGDYIPVYQTIWKGREKIGIIRYTDPLTGEEQEEQIDEAEEPILAMYGEGATVEWIWVTRAYETWRIGNDIYVRKKPVDAQRNALNNFSTVKLPVNGRKYSDTHSQNISVMQIGMPYLIMYMIVNRTLELTIAKSKGKIIVMDNNAIPRTKGWTEEKFFYYSEALGYALVDRNQLGVDKSFNQYAVLDMGLFKEIEQLINLQKHYKQEWDEIIGITRQRKGQTFASETNSSNEAATFQSTLITEMIFMGFDDFVLREMQGLIDLSKFANADGLRRLYNGDEEGDILLEITPEDYCYAAFGVLATDNAQDANVLEMMKQNAPHFIQNDVKPSTILQMFQSGNIPELASHLKQIEEIQARVDQQTMEQQAEMEAAADERKMKFMEYEKMLEEQLIHVEYDRKDQLEEIKGSFNIASFNNDEDAATDEDTTADILKANTEREKIRSQERIKAADIASKERTAKIKEYLSLRKSEMQEANKKQISDAKIAGDIKKARVSAAKRNKK